ncbi:MAG: hypothetical protein U0232_15630 [Thermomicrobiales bacterium]
MRRRFRRPIARGITPPDRRMARGLLLGYPGRALATVLLIALTVPWLAGFGSATAFREPGLLPGGPDESLFTLADLARLRSQPAPPVVTARSVILWDATANQELYSKAPGRAHRPGQHNEDADHAADARTGAARHEDHRRPARHQPARVRRIVDGAAGGRDADGRGFCSTAR